MSTQKKLSLTLASASPRRKDLLNQIGIEDFYISPAEINESVRGSESVRAYALRMACEKARAVRGDMVIGGDTVVAVGKRILPKAEDRATAMKCLKMLSGRRHTVYGGLCLKVGEVEHTAIVKTVVKFKNLSEKEIEFYLNSNDWDGKAGGYAIQGLASRYISFISGSYTNVVGLDVHTISQWLERYGY